MRRPASRKTGQVRARYGATSHNNERHIISHVHTFHRDVDLSCRTQAKHHAFSATRINRANSVSPNPQPLAMRRPFPSISTKPAPGSGGASNFTWTSRCSGRPTRRRYRPKLLRTIPLCRQYSIWESPLARNCCTTCWISSELRRRAMPPVSANLGPSLKRGSSHGYEQTALEPLRGRTTISMLL